MSAQEESAMPAGLSDLEVRILDFEGSWWRYAGAKEAAIKELIRSDNTKTIEQYYNYGLSKLMNAKSRDGRAGVNRNG